MEKTVPKLQSAFSFRISEQVMEMTVPCPYGQPHHKAIMVLSLSRVRLFVTPWTAVHQAPLSLGFSRQEYWRGLPFPSPGDLSNPGIEPGSPALQAGSLPTELQGKPNIKGAKSSVSLVSHCMEIAPSHATVQEVPLQECLR